MSIRGLTLYVVNAFLGGGGNLNPARSSVKPSIAGSPEDDVFEYGTNAKDIPITIVNCKLQRCLLHQVYCMIQLRTV